MDTKTSPQLLVSVRDRSEFELASRTDLHIIGVKEPDNGELGRASIDTLHDIAKTIERLDLQQLTSIALGELADGQSSIQQVLEMPWISNFNFVKFGLAGTLNTNWQDSLADSLKILPETVGFVVVAYGDHEHAQAPDPNTILDIGIELGCRGILLDTYVKDGKSILDHMSTVEICDLLGQARSANCFSVLAGSLKAHNADQILEIGPDVVGFRGAACEVSRTGTISANAIDRLSKSFQTRATR